jgi:hypothetical protein
MRWVPVVVRVGQLPQAGLHMQQEGQACQEGESVSVSHHVLQCPGNARVLVMPVDSTRAQTIKSSAWLCSAVLGCAQH